MKIFLLVLILFAFLQSAFLPVNLILICLIARSLLIQDSSNYYLAFFGGLILSFLTQDNMGYWPLILLLTVKICYMISKLPISLTPFTVTLWAGIIIFSLEFLNMIFMHTNFEFVPALIETLLIIPAFYLIRVWEGRFIVKRNIKLKI